jgi:hypothetical protein
MNTEYRLAVAGRTIHDINRRCRVIVRGGRDLRFRGKRRESTRVAEQTYAGLAVIEMGWVSFRFRVLELGLESPDLN